MYSVLPNNWLKRLFRGRRSRAAMPSRRRRNCRLALEILEERVVPTLAETSVPLSVLYTPTSSGPVNTSDPDQQFGLMSRSVARAANGDFVEVWQEGYSGGVEARLFGPTGQPLTGMFHVNAPGDISSEPTVAMNASGAFVVAWTDKISSTQTNVYAQRFYPSGSLQGALISVATWNQLQDSPSVAMDSAGNFVVAFDRKIGTLTKVWTNRYNAYGNLVQSTPIDGFNTHQMYYPSVAMNATGSYVVAYQYDFSAYDKDIRAQRFDANGNAQGGVFTVAGSYLPEEHPSVAINSSGAFVVAYTLIVTQTQTPGATASFSNFAYTSDVYVARYGPQGTRLSNTLIANLPIEEDGYSVALDDQGNYLVAYQSAINGRYGGGRTVHVQTVNSQDQFGNGALTIPVNAFGGPNQENLMPSLAEDPLGGAVVAWINNAPNGLQGLGSNTAYFQTFTVADYRIEASLPAGQSEVYLTNGTSVTVNLTIYRDPKFSGAVNLSVVGALPAGVGSTASSPKPSAPSVENRTVKFTAAASLPGSGSAQVTIRALSAGEPEIDIPVVVSVLAGGITSVQGANNVPSQTLVPGTPLNIFGTELAQGSTVLFPTRIGLPPIVVTPNAVNPSGTAIFVTVPDGIGNGRLAVRTPSGGYFLAPGTFTVSEGGITGISPRVGIEPEGLHPGTPILITGYGMVPGSRVQFGDPNNITNSALATPSSITADGSNLYVDVPPYAITGPITVLRPNGKQFQSGPNLTFTVDDYRNTNGFNFRNYSANVTFDLVASAFGDDQTHISVDDALGPFGIVPKLLGLDASTPVPSPAALAFTAFAASAINNNGECFGMDLTAQLLLNNPNMIDAQYGLPPGAPPPPTVFELAKNSALLQLIEEEHLYQFSAEMIKYFAGWQTSVHDNASVYNQLAALLQSGDHPLISVREGLGQGHVLTAYNLEGGPDKFYIDVYDPNRPFGSQINSDVSTSETTSLSAHVQLQQESRIQVVNNQWSFGYLAGRKPDGTENIQNWSGGFGTLTVVPYGTIPSQPTLPTSLDGLTTLIFGGAGSGITTVTNIPALSLSSAGDLTINGVIFAAGSTNTLDIARTSVGGTQVTVNGTVTSYAPGAVRSITFYGGQGNDTLDIDSLPARVPVTFYLGTGNDTVNLSPTAHAAATLAGSVDIVGGLGTDVLNLDDQADAANTTYTMTGSTLQVGGLSIQHSLIDQININGGRGIDTYDIQGTEQKFTTALNTGSSLYTLNLTGSSGPVFVNGQLAGQVALQLDLHNLSAPSINLDSTVITTAQTPAIFALTPGVHSLTNANGPATPLYFTVHGDGIVTYDPSLQGVLSSPAPGQLTVNGVTVSVNQRLSNPMLVIDDSIVERSAPTFQLHLLPGSHTLAEEASGGQAAFAVDAQGDVTFDPSLAGILVSPGRNQLNVNGVTVSVSQQLSDPLLVVDDEIVERSAPTFQLQLLPGGHTLMDGPSGGQAAFAVDAQGDVTFDSSLDGVLVSPGRNQLQVNGVTVSVNQQLSDPLLVVDDYIVERSAPTFQIQLLPGSHMITEYATGGQAAFAVDAQGNVTFDPALARVFASPARNQLNITGLAVTIDARALSDSSVVVDAYSVEQTNVPFQLVFLPGTHTIASLDGSRKITFTIDDSGNVSYDPAEDTLLSGQGTSTLVVKSLG